MNFFKSWKTLLSGIVALLPVILPMFGVPVTPEQGMTIVSLAAGAGLAVAKDGNVHGGTVDAGVRPTDKGNV